MWRVGLKEAAWDRARARSTPAGIWAELFLGGGAGGHSGSLVLDGGGPGPAFLWGR